MRDGTHKGKICGQIGPRSPLHRACSADYPAAFTAKGATGRLLRQPAHVRIHTAVVVPLVSNMYASREGKSVMRIFAPGFLSSRTPPQLARVASVKRCLPSLRARPRSLSQLITARCDLHSPVRVRVCTLHRPSPQRVAPLVNSTAFSFAISRALASSSHSLLSLLIFIFKYSFFYWCYVRVNSGDGDAGAARSPRARSLTIGLVDTALIALL